MTNPIDNGSRITRSPVSGTGRRNNAENSPTAGAAQTPISSARTDATLHSDRLQAVQDAIRSTPEVDQKLVADIRERIAQGDYPLHVERIAQRFTEFEKLLHG